MTNKYYIIENQNDFEVIELRDTIVATQAVSVYEFLKSKLDDSDASFYNYLYEHKAFSELVGVTPEEIYPSLKKGADLLNTMSRSEVYEELCQHNKLATLFKEEAKSLVRMALVRKAREFLEEAMKIESQ